MKRLKRLLIVLTLNIVWGSCWVSSADAGVITTGTWTAMNPSANPNAFWNHMSWDGPGLNVGQLITSWGVPVDYLSAGDAPVAFAFDQSEFFWEATSITAWMDGRGICQLADGSVTFGTHGYTYNTLTTPQQFSLFRYVGTASIIYFLGVEDIPSTMRSDHDYNDFVAEVRFANPIPEAQTYAMVLAGLGLLGFAARRRRLPA